MRRRLARRRRKRRTRRRLRPRRRPWPPPTVTPTAMPSPAARRKRRRTRSKVITWSRGGAESSRFYWELFSCLRSVLNYCYRFGTDATITSNEAAPRCVGETSGRFLLLFWVQDYCACSDTLDLFVSLPHNYHLMFYLERVLISLNIE